MASVKNIKVAVFGMFAILLFVWLVSGTFQAAIGKTDVNQQSEQSVSPTPNPDEYVGSETCAACHEDQFKAVADTKHGKLENLPGWKDKMVGCESCHGGGKAHVESSGDKTKIISFKNKNSKEISESCLGCHSGKEEHNNFRRGDHWRNNIGCTDCHSAHGVSQGTTRSDSISLVSRSTRQIPGESAMLKSSEPQLCISCHSEMKAQFSKPFRHKVLEGAMNCSDCHNPHGGFETRQTRLAVGVDAACIKCHSDKQGPFVFEHAPLKVEGCSACHTPHGSANPKMLKRPQVRQLCLECHSGITDQLSDGPSSGPHTQNNIRSQNCTVCHSAIHGSNTSNAFFR
jgi:predicted CXXCH cytochrome family protein